MIIDLTKSKLFTVDPDIRFSKEYALERGVWIELWRKYKILQYSNGDLRDYLFIKHARNLDFTSMWRWIVRSEIYSISHRFIKDGARYVNSDVFGAFEENVMKELVKQHKYSDSLNSKTII